MVSRLLKVSSPPDFRGSAIEEAGTTTEAKKSGTQGFSPGNGSRFDWMSWTLFQRSKLPLTPCRVAGCRVCVCVASIPAKYSMHSYTVQSFR